jgi:hypothetical protein
MRVWAPITRLEVSYPYAAAVVFKWSNGVLEISGERDKNSCDVIHGLHPASQAPIQKGNETQDMDSFDARLPRRPCPRF